MQLHISRYVRVGFTAALLFAVVLAPGCDRPMKLQVHTEPPGAKLYWNTQPLGTAPRVVLLPSESAGFPEMHVFEARKSGYEPAFHYLTARSRPSLTGPAKITIRLTKLPAGLSDADVPDALPYTPPASKKKESLFTGALACELRLVRVSDGKVLCQVSGIARQEHIALCAEQLAEQLKAQAPPGGGTLAVATTRNRRESELGRDLAEKMTQNLQRELSFNSPFGVAKELDLNDLVGEDMKDVSYILRDPEVAAELCGVRYVVLSGLAETIEPE